jgi:hypothetical protein
MTNITKIDERLLEWAAPRQAEMIAAVNRLGSVRLAAIELGMVGQETNIHRAIRKVKANAARHGYAPGHFQDGVAPGYLMGKVTVQRAGGAVERTWERQSPDQVAWANAIKEGVRAFVEDIDPIPAAPAMPGRDADIIPWINIGDAHFGMLAHEAETGANFDLKIAERELCAAISTLIDETGEHDRIVINDVGDFTHYENTSATTEASGHALDHDGRFPKMIKVYSRTMRFIIDKALEKANFVDVIVNQGNHSRTNDMWMAELLRVAYAHTDRVNVLNNDSVFIGYRMGSTFVMTHHSDKCRPARLASVMATDFATDWGETEYRYIDIGHIHHNMVLKEHPGVSIESFNQLAAKDKWANDGGYRSRQSITVIDRSRTYGEVGRRVLPIRRVRDLIEAAHKARGEAAPYRPAERRAFAV